MQTNEPFYWKNVDIENYENIMSEMRNRVLSTMANINGFSKYDVNKLETTCNLFMEWLDAKSLKIRSVAIIKLMPNQFQEIHKDFLPDLNNTNALNLNLSNCIDNYTRMFKLHNDSIPKISFSPNGKPFYMYHESQCTEISRYNLTKPVLVNVNELHQVINRSNAPRISISFRFTSIPEL